jgi:5-(carboxyamino)imidazole ribonucleotide synthase
MQTIGILGGGQLGRMLLQAAANYPCYTKVLEKSTDCPSAQVAHEVVIGDFNEYDHVYNFGKTCDVITWEIEHVNVDALLTLENEGKTIIPKPSVLQIIKNKARQKEFYAEQQIPTAPFTIHPNKEHLLANLPNYPFIVKTATGGYDGKGVFKIEDETELYQIPEGELVAETLADLDKEIAIIVAINQHKQVVQFPPVEMVFNPQLNLVDYLISPIDLPEQQLWRIEAIAQKLVQSLKSPGLFAIELFINKDGNIWVNETAPRVHNSGHHTIEANYCSQFDMLWRILLNLPLGNPAARSLALMRNLVGSEHIHFNDPTIFENILKQENVYLHWYGKKETKPGRKLGHITILGNTKQDVLYTNNRLSEILHEKH